jgi:hypothetical protein
MSKGNSHKHDCENFYWPKVNATSSGFASSNIDVGKSNGIIRDEAFVLTFQGLKVQELVCGDGVWRIERCPPSSNNHCSTNQRDSMKHCDTKIIAQKIVHGIPSPYYNGLWFNLKGFAPICQKFYICPINVANASKDRLDSIWGDNIGGGKICFVWSAQMCSSNFFCEWEYNTS